MCSMTEIFFLGLQLEVLRVSGQGDIRKQIYEGLTGGEAEMGYRLVLRRSYLEGSEPSSLGLCFCTNEISFQGTLRSSLGQCQEHTLYEKQFCLQDVEGGRNKKRTDRLRQWKDRVSRLATMDVMSAMCPASY